MEHSITVSGLAIVQLVLHLGLATAATETLVRCLVLVTTVMTIAIALFLYELVILVVFICSLKR